MPMPNLHLMLNSATNVNILLLFSPLNSKFRPSISIYLLKSILRNLKFACILILLFVCSKINPLYLYADGDVPLTGTRFTAYRKAPGRAARGFFLYNKQANVNKFCNFAARFKSIHL